MNQSVIIWAVVVPLLLWRVYTRLQRSVGRQAFRPSGLGIAFSIFLIVSLLFGARSINHPPLMLGWLAGFVPGAILGFWALHLTRFETTAEGRFYTPNAHIGVALSLVFIGRIIYRITVIYMHAAPDGRVPPPMGSSALTFAAFELLAGYYMVYNGGVLKKFGRPEPQAAASR